MTDAQEYRQRKEQHYQRALEANGEIQAFIIGHRAATGDDPAAEKWRKFVEDRARIMMNAAFLLGEELEDEGAP